MEECFYNMKKAPDIDFDAVARDTAMVHPASAKQRFWRIMSQRRPPWLPANRPASVIVKGGLPPLGVSTRSSTRNEAQATEASEPSVSNHPDGVNGADSNIDEEDYDFSINDDLDDDMDSVYSESEYLARFQADVASSAATKVKLEDNDFDMDLDDD